MPRHSPSPATPSPPPPSRYPVTTASPAPRRAPAPPRDSVRQMTTTLSTCFRESQLKISALSIASRTEIVLSQPSLGRTAPSGNFHHLHICLTSLFRHLCILYSSCEPVVTPWSLCSDCHTSPADCPVSSFEGSIAEGSCATVLHLPPCRVCLSVCLSFHNTSLAPTLYCLQVSPRYTRTLASTTTRSKWTQG